MPSIAQIRQMYPDAKDASDADIVDWFAKTTGTSVLDAANSLGVGNPNRGVTGQQFSSSIDRYQAGLYGVGEAVTKAAGLNKTSSWLEDQRRTNEMEADVAEARAKAKGAVTEWKDVQGVGDFGSYAKNLAIQSAPYAAEALTGGLIARGVMSGTRAALAGAKTAEEALAAKKALDLGSTVGGVAASYPSAVGDILSNQREQSGKTDLLAAGALAIPYAGLNALGVDTALMRGSAFKNTINLLDRPGGLLGAAARTTATATGVGLKEGISETGQEVLNQAGRMAVDPNATLTDPEALERYKESFIGGATLGGLMGGGLGGWRRSTPATNDIQQAFNQPEVSGTPTANVAPPVTPPITPANHPDPMARLAELEAIGRGTPARTVEGPDGQPLKIPATEGRFFTPEEQQEYKALKAQVANMTPPVVTGGTTDIAQQSQAAAAQNQQAEIAQQQQAKRDDVLGVLASEYSPDTVSIFGQTITGPRIAPFGNRFADVFNTLPPHVQQIAKAIVQANKAFATPEKPSPLVSFSFNATNPRGSAEKAIAALGKTMTKFQIDHVQSLDEAVQILNKLSTTTKGNQLEQLNAIYEAITGQDTDGFIAAQTAKAEKGAKDGKLPLQTTTGLGTVPVEGGTGETTTTADGTVQPSGVQSVQSGSVPEGSLGLQTGQLSGEGIRTGTSADANVGNGNAPSQVTGATSEQASQSALGGGETSGQSQQAGTPNVDQQSVQNGPRTYDPRISFYSTDLSHISSERRVQLISDLLLRVLAPIQNRTNTVPAEKRAEILRLALLEQFRHADIAAYTGLKVDAVEKQLERMGVKLVDGEFQVVDPAFAARFVEAAAAYRAPEFPDGIGQGELAGLYNTRYEGEEQSAASLAEELEAGEQEGKPGAKLQEELGGKENAEGQTMGMVSTAGGSQGAVDSEGAAFFAKVEKLQAELEAMPPKDPRRAAKAEQLQKLWADYAKGQEKRRAKGEAAVTEEGDENAVQVESADEGNVREPAGGGKKVGKGNAKPKKSAGKAEVKVEPKQEAKAEEVKTPAEEWAALSQLAPELPAYELLAKSEKTRWDDLVHRGQANLAAAVKIVGEKPQPAGTVLASEKPETTGTDGTAEAVNPKFGKDGVATNPYTAAELVKDIKDFIRADILGRKLVIVGSLEDLANSNSADLQNLAKAIGNKGAYGVTANGTAYLIANRISKGEGRAKFMHEVGAHLGLEKLLPKVVYDQLTAQLARWVASKDNSLESRIAKKAQARVDAAQTETQDKPAELLAYFVEESMLAGIDPAASGKLTGPLATWFRTLWSAIQAIARKLGFRTDKLTAQDVVNMAYGAAKIEMSDAQRNMSTANRTQFGIAGQRSFYNLDPAETDKLKAQLVKAKLMFAAGATEDKMWVETGWFKGIDGKWKYEIPDTNAKFKPFKNDRVEIDHDYELQDVLEHPALFKAYPQLKDYTLVFDADMPPKNASFDPFNGRITMSGQYPDDMPTLLHEIQHAIQQIEGFDPGGSPNHIADPLSIVSFVKFEAILRQTGQQKAALAIEKILSHIARYDDLVNEAQLQLVLNTDPVKTAGLQMNLDRAVDTYVLKAQQALELYKITEEQMRSYLYYGIAGEQEARMVEGRLTVPVDKLATTLPKLELDSNATLLVDKTGMAMKFGVNAPSTTDTVISALPRVLRKPVRNVVTNLLSAAKKGLYSAAMTEDIVSMAKKFMPSATKYLDAQYARYATRVQFENRINKILTAYDRLPANLKGEGSGSVNEFIFDSTREKKWGYYPGEHQVGTKLFEVDPDFEERFNKIQAQSPAAAQLIKDVFEHGYQALQMKKQAARDAVDREYESREKAAANDADLLDKIAKEKASALKRIASLQQVQVGNPYAYLGRYGNYVVVAKSPEFIAYEKAASGTESRTKDNSIIGDPQQAKNWLQDHISDPNHYVVEFAETQAEADEIAAQLGATGQYDVQPEDAAEKEAHASYAGGADLMYGLSRLRGMAERGGEDTNPALTKAIGDLYLMVVAESSARQRKNVAGASKNMMRNLATSGRADAHFLASMASNDAISDSLESMRVEAQKNLKEARPLYNELYARNALSMDYKPVSDLVTALTRMTSLWTLSTNPAFYLQQMVQTMVLSQPYMAGRLGYFRTGRALKRAYSDIAPLTKDIGIEGHIDFNQAPSDVRNMLNTLVGMGKIDIGIETDIKARTEERGPFEVAMAKLKGVNTRIESINRAAAAVAAYRGYLERYKNGDTAAATKYAAEVIDNTHGSYTSTSAPRILQGNTASLLGQFKRFQIIQLSMLIKLINNSFRGASKEERAVAFASLKFIVAHMAVLGGALGVPFVSQIAWLASKAFGDPDEPDDYEYKLRRMIGDGPAADLLLRGVPAYFGLESLGKKLSMENVASPFGPFVEPDLASRSGAEKMLVGMMGPAASMGLKFADALDLISKGNYYKGLEMAMPNGVANVMKAYRFPTQGITMRNGDLVMSPDEVSMIDAGFQLVGLPTSTVTDRQFTQKVVAEFDKFYAERAKDIKASYVESSRASDSAAMAEARDDWQKLQESRVRNGYKRQGMSELFRAPAEARKRERGVVGGVETTKSNRRFVESQVNQ